METKINKITLDKKNTPWIETEKSSYAFGNETVKGCVDILNDFGTEEEVVFKFHIYADGKTEDSQVKKYMKRIKAICNGSGLAWTALNNNDIRYSCIALRM